MWELREHIQELQQQHPMQLNGRLLLVRCRLLKDGAPTPADRRHQSLLMDLLLRVLRRRFAPRDPTYQVSETDALVVLLTRAAVAAIPIVQESIDEIRRRLLGEGEAPRDAITVDAVTIGENGDVTTTEILSADGTFKRSLLDGRLVDLPPVDAGKFLKPGDLRHEFTPVWDVGRKAITTYYLSCAALKIGFGEQRGYDVLHGGTKSSFVPDLDIGVLERAEAELAQYKDGKVPFVLVWTLHTRTVEHHEKFQRYAATLARMAERAQGRMVVEVRGIRPDWPVSRMHWAIGAVRRYCRGVTVRQKLDPSIIPQLAACGASNISVDMSDVSDHASEIPRLKKFCEAVGKQRMAAVGHRVPGRHAAFSAVSAGFAYVNGDFLGRGGVKPEPASRYDVIDLINASADLGIVDPRPRRAV